MAYHKSSEKRIRQTEARNERNRYYSKSTRSAIKKLRDSTKKTEASEQLLKVVSMLDKLAKKKVIHANKAANLKSSLTKHVNSL